MFRNWDGIIESQQISDAAVQPIKGRGRPFEPGQRGNPSGRPKGARNKTTIAVEALLDNEAEALTRKLIELATSRRKIDVCGIVVNTPGKAKPAGGDRRGVKLDVVTA